ncbi:hypothetical protein PINS_up005477 [Pythium insidiosum]|nr:hypothetical protein PINS_up005477 [Pythium insidiosum]
MAGGGISLAITRLFRSLRRKHDPDGENDDSTHDDASHFSGLMSNAVASRSSTVASSANKVAFPSAFARQARHIVEYSQQLNKLVRVTNGSSGSIARRRAAVLKTVDRLVTMLQERQDNEKASRHSRAIPLNIAVEQLLMAWESALLCIDLSMHSTSSIATASTDRNSSESSSSSNSSGSEERASELETAATTLIKLIVQQKELDLALLALGNGRCNAHPETAMNRKRTPSEARRDDRLRVSVSRRESRRSLAKGGVAKPTLTYTKKDGKTHDLPLCQLARRCLDLHQSTIRTLQPTLCSDDVNADSRSSDTSSSCSSRMRKRERELLLHVMAASYVRLAPIRNAVLSVFEMKSEASNRRGRRPATTRSRRRSYARRRSSTVRGEANVPLHSWSQHVSVKCAGMIAPFDRDDTWSAESDLIRALLADQRFQRRFIAELIDYLIETSSGNVEWKSVPGAMVLKKVVLATTQEIYQSQLRAMESTVNDADENDSATVKQSDVAKQVFSFSRSGDPTIPIFYQRVMKMMDGHRPFIHEWMMTILRCTSYTRAHHVTVCLQYMEQLVTRFPSYFMNEAVAGVGVDGAVDVETMGRVFTCLLRSEHFQILKGTQLFLLKHFSVFSVTIRDMIVQEFASQFKRLFLHWHRDVRFCYFHVLLYLTYPGNRIVLGAKSDELILGSEAAAIFDIHGLVRSAASKKWEAFDAPLCELLTAYNRVARPQRAKAPASFGRSSMSIRPKPSSRSSTRPSLAMRHSISVPPAPMSAPANYSTAPVREMPKLAPWVEELKFPTIQRSVQEYRRHVQTYFQCAQQISIHEQVPTPEFHQQGRHSS